MPWESSAGASTQLTRIPYLFVQGEPMPVGRFPPHHPLFTVKRKGDHGTLPSRCLPTVCLTLTALGNRGQALPRPSLHPHALMLSHDSLGWWVWGNCTEERCLPSMSHWGAHCECDLLPLTLTPGLRCRPGFSSVQKQVAQSARPPEMGAVGCDPRAFTGLSRHSCWASGKLPGLLGLRAVVRTWLSSPAGPPPGEDTGGAEDPGGCRNRPGGSGKSWWLVSGEDLGKTHLKEIPEPGARSIPAWGTPPPPP